MSVISGPTPFEDRVPALPPLATGARRILSLDGGGVRGVFSLEILKRIESLLRARTGNPDLRLAQYFDMIAGTSTGAIIASFLSWGMEVREVKELYSDRAAEIFKRAVWYKRLSTKFESQRIAGVFQSVFREDDGSPAALGTPKLRTLLVVVVRNATTDSPWVLTNNPHAIYNDPSLDNCNLKIPLWRLVRASTAAPTYFPPESLTIGGDQFLFIDGGVTPYNNPAMAAYMTATLPCYRIGWPTGEEKMLVISVGTSRLKNERRELQANRMNLLYSAMNIPTALITSVGREQDLICRTFGRCVAGEPLDSEIGDLINADSTAPRHFTYARYEHTLGRDDVAKLEALGRKGYPMDDIGIIPFLQDLGRSCAERQVRPEHLL